MICLSGAALLKRKSSDAGFYTSDPLIRLISVILIDVGSKLECPHWVEGGRRNFEWSQSVFLWGRTKLNSEQPFLANRNSGFKPVAQLEIRVARVMCGFDMHKDIFLGIVDPVQESVALGPIEPFNRNVLEAASRIEKVLPTCLVAIVLVCGIRGIAEIDRKNLDCPRPSLVITSDSFEDRTLREAAPPMFG